MATTTERIPSQEKIDEVFRIADELSAAGEKPTIQKIRDRIGGSNTDVSYALNRWKERQKGEIVCSETPELERSEVTEGEEVEAAPTAIDSQIRNALLDGAIAEAAAVTGIAQGQLARQILENPTPEMRDRILQQLGQRTANAQVQGEAASPKSLAMGLVASIL